MDDYTIFPKNFDQHKCCKFKILFLGILFQQVTGQAPDNVTLEMTKLDHNDSDPLYVGGTINVELSISFPIGITRNVVVEVAPSINGTVMAMGRTDDWLDDIKTELLLSNLVANMSTRIAADMESDKGIVYKDKLILDFGDITVPTDATLEGSTLYFSCEMVVVNTDNLVDENHWVFAGIEYNSGTYIWVGQAVYVVSLDNPAVSNIAEYEIDDLSEMSIGSSHFFNITMFVTNPRGLIAIEGIVQNDTTDLSVAQIMVIDAGQNFKYCMNFNALQTSGYQCPTGVGKKSLRLEIPGITNRGSRLEEYIKEDSKIVVQVLVLMAYDVDIVGNLYSIGFGVSIEEQEIWVTRMHITAAAQSQTSLVTSISVEAFGETDIPIGHPAQAVVKVTTEQLSGILTINATSRGQNSDTAFRISAVNVLKSGSNLPCITELLNVDYAIAITGSNIVDGVSIKFIVKNNGMTRGDKEANTVELHVTFVAVGGTAPENSRHDVMAYNEIYTSTVTFTLVATIDYDTGVTYEFTLLNECNSTCVLSGGTVGFEVTVATEVNKTTESMTIEFPLPGNTSLYMFTICSYKITFIGRNIGCVNNKSLTILDNRTDTDGSYNLRFQVIPMCNLGLWMGEDDNTLKFAVKLRLRDIPGVLDATIVDWFGFGINYSDDSNWIGHSKITAFSPNSYSSLKLLEGIKVERDSLNSTWLGNFLVQSSEDGLTYYNIANDNSSWNIGDGNTTHDVYMLVNPMLVTHARLTSMKCVTQCAVNHEFIVSDVDDFIEIYHDKDGALKRKIVLLQDGNNSTCFDLPSIGETPPVYWLRANTSLFFLTATSYELWITGKGLNCQRDGTSVTQVSYPTSSSMDGFHGDLKFCDSGTPTTESDTTTCSFICNCPDVAQCSEFFIYITRIGDISTDPWQLCEITGINR